METTTVLGLLLVAVVLHTLWYRRKMERLQLDAAKTQTNDWLSLLTSVSALTVYNDIDRVEKHILSMSRSYQLAALHILLEIADREQYIELRDRLLPQVQGHDTDAESINKIWLRRFSELE